MNGMNSDLHGRQRLDDIPSLLRWMIVFIKEVGFPIAVAIYMGYIALTEIPKMSSALDNNTRVMTTLADSVQHNIKSNERAFRKILGNKYPDDP
jgi:hypothetical protein